MSIEPLLFAPIVVSDPSEILPAAVAVPVPFATNAPFVPVAPAPFNVSALLIEKPFSICNVPDVLGVPKLLTVAAAVPSAALFCTSTIPVLIVEPPLYVFVPLRNNVPVPFFVSEPCPDPSLMMPLSVMLPVFVL